MTLRSLVFVGVVLSLLSAPAFATSHSGRKESSKKESSKKESVLLDSGSKRGHSPLPSVVTLPSRVDLAFHQKAQKWDREKLERWFAKWREKYPHKPREPKGGGTPPVVIPPDAPPTAMPEPSAALLFAVGTGVVALGLRQRPQLSSSVRARFGQ